MSDGKATAAGRRTASREFSMSIVSSTAVAGRDDELALGGRGVTGRDVPDEDDEDGESNVVR